MVLDYSKWDALELSDDSDIEVHPNVDKRSFIRAKQTQIHHERAQRRHQIETFKYERIINDGLLTRIESLLVSLKKRAEDTTTTTKGADELVFQALIETAAGQSGDDDAPPLPTVEGVYANEKDRPPKYSEMMGSLVDQVKKEVDESNPADDKDKLQAYINGVEGHKNKVQGLQQELLEKLAELEKIEKSKITSEDIHTGFSSSFIAKDSPETSSKAKKKNEGEKPTAGPAVELLNPSAVSPPDPVSSGAEADIEDEGEADEESIKATPLARAFAKLKPGDYSASLQFISSHPEVVAERKTDELLMEAFDAQLNGNEDYARQCVHQGLLLQYCRSLGKDGVGLFFKRITTKGHRASILFRDDVNDTYHKIKSRAHTLAQQSAAGTSSEQIEQIQLHAVDPNTTISISIPPPISTSTNEAPDADAIEAREIFESFSPAMQGALETQSLDAVNKVLGEMRVDDAEEVVEMLSRGGILKVEEGIVDATTEEGKKVLEELEREGKEEIGDPE
ncbi:hypothetical protein AJ80_03072 [Polytolypa hystricis UAMH7299]|uniref:Hsp90 chaperone protein kinase-targeting subunit n=1 Tax=Polytolypa hystricis (strain UAMH7299) TaxID=1447883 RepID=A0A2B7YKP6_POLH7|nr:hypothetical protein AJ80_03072 [Polytolypa hystricis UAMH7299]